MSLEPYFDDGTVTLYLGDCREIVPALGLKADLIVADPPYGETSLVWDRWPAYWPGVAATAANSMWCFGSMRMLMHRAPEFIGAGWKFSHDVVWEKSNGSGATADRFRRVHEHASHWYQGAWGEIYHKVPRVPATPKQIARNGSSARVTRADHRGLYGTAKRWTDDGTRLMRSVIRVQSMRGRAIHPTEKPLKLLDSLIRYACPTGGLVLDPFAGSCSTLDAARRCGRRAIGIEGFEPYAKAAAKRLSQPVLDFEATP